MFRNWENNHVSVWGNNHPVIKVKGSNSYRACLNENEQSVKFGLPYKYGTWMC